MEKQLHQLINEVCEHPLKSPKRRKIMNRLLIEFQRLPKLAKSSHPDYLDALNKTWEWVNRSICEQFDTSKPMVEERLQQWINSYLYWRIKDLHSLDKNKVYSLDATTANNNTEITYLELLSEKGFDIPTRSGIDSYIEQLERGQRQNISLKLENYFEKDPEGKLRNCHLRGNPECNCHILSQRRFLNNPPEKFTVLAKDFNVKYQTLKSHWERNCSPLLQEIAKDLGYENE